MKINSLKGKTKVFLEESGDEAEVLREVCIREELDGFHESI